jgi:hypothetical protein
LFTIPKLWNTTDECPTTDKWIKNMWYLYTMEFYSATKNNEILLFAGNEWNWTTSSSVKLVRFRRPKATCFLSQAEYRPNTNVAILWETGHAKGRLYSRGAG